MFGIFQHKKQHPLRHELNVNVETKNHNFLTSIQVINIPINIPIYKALFQNIL